MADTYRFRGKTYQLEVKLPHAYTNIGWEEVVERAIPVATNMAGVTPIGTKYVTYGRFARKAVYGIKSGDERKLYDETSEL